ncbi:LysM peptidoglycan-binding domain-containing protein [Microbacterium terrisoli]|uniref:LysM peptidoglycan-binding domain-containing protein n=1 Tax=Microbacterium terrisoli TaxID=3242192 RepID=UPI0028047F33|nr:LysM peptidoglycan-binding domain-containing protein [Microbacterium protaetiae]
MRTFTKITTLLAGVALASALAGCTATAEPASDGTPAATKDAPVASAPAPTAVESAPSAATCADSPTARINMPTYAYNTRPVSAPELVGVVTDTGALTHASGKPTRDGGQIVSYIVQPGDALDAIAARFCMDLNSFSAFNHATGRTLQPGEILELRPDPAKPWAWDN